MLRVYKKQAVAVSESGKILMMGKTNYGIFDKEITRLLCAATVELSPGIYIANLLVYLGLGKAAEIELDVDRQLVEYRDYDIYSGEVKLV